MPPPQQPASSDDDVLRMLGGGQTGAAAAAPPSPDDQVHQALVTMGQAPHITEDDLKAFYKQYQQSYSSQKPIPESFWANRPVLRSAAIRAGASGQLGSQFVPRPTTPQMAQAPEEGGDEWWNAALKTGLNPLNYGAPLPQTVRNAQGQQVPLIPPGWSRGIQTGTTALKTAMEGAGLAFPAPLWPMTLAIGRAAGSIPQNIINQELGLQPWDPGQVGRDVMGEGITGGIHGGELAAGSALLHAPGWLGQLGQRFGLPGMGALAGMSTPGSALMRSLPQGLQNFLRPPSWLGGPQAPTPPPTLPPGWRLPSGSPSNPPINQPPGYSPPGPAAPTQGNLPPGWSMPPQAPAPASWPPGPYPGLGQQGYTIPPAMPGLGGPFVEPAQGEIVQEEAAPFQEGQFTVTPQLQIGAGQQPSAQPDTGPSGTVFTGPETLQVPPELPPGTVRGQLGPVGSTTGTWQFGAGRGYTPVPDPRQFTGGAGGVVPEGQFTDVTPQEAAPPTTTAPQARPPSPATPATEGGPVVPADAMATEAGTAQPQAAEAGKPTTFSGLETLSPEEMNLLQIKNLGGEGMTFDEIRALRQRMETDPMLAQTMRKTMRKMFRVP